MSKILLVDDDALIVEFYRKKLLSNGYDVVTAADGFAALKLLQSEKPDLLLLDLMMPRFNGFEVLHYIRSHPDLTHTRVIVLSNLYSGEAEKMAASAKPDVTLPKSACTPRILLETIETVLTRGTVISAPSPVSAPARPAAQADLQARTRTDFLKNAPATLATLRQLNEAFIRSESQQAQSMRLLDFYRKAHFLTASAGLAGFEQLALFSSAFEALLFELQEKPDFVNPSTLQTIAYTLDFLSTLLAAAEHAAATPLKPGKALVVDDDAVSNHALVAALRGAKVSAVGAQDPVIALRTLEQDAYSLVLLDIQMPGMDGFELCQKLRTMPQYKKTPIIFVTGHADFDNRLHSVLSGGNDLICKPVFPIELAVKALTHLLRSQLPEPWGSS